VARIRTVKPEFFRHEALQDLEIANPGMYPMMVFAALWGHCDSKGRFEWKPRMLKLDILPFLPFDMAKTLDILHGAGMLHRYTVDGKEYGLVDTFEKHQRITGKEATEGEKHPSPTGETTGKQQGNTEEFPESQEGKGREKEKEGKPSAPAAPIADPVPVSESRKSSICFKTYVAECQHAGKKPIPETDPVFDWAEKAKLPDEFLRLAWLEFRDRFKDSPKRYRDWPRVFRNAVRDNWYGVWFCDGNGQMVLTSKGRTIAQTMRTAV